MTFSYIFIACFFKQVFLSKNYKKYYHKKIINFLKILSDNDNIDLLQQEYVYEIITTSRISGIINKS